MNFSLVFPSRRFDAAFAVLFATFGLIVAVGRGAVERVQRTDVNFYVCRDFFFLPSDSYIGDRIRREVSQEQRLCEVSTKLSSIFGDNLIINPSQHDHN